MPFMLACDTLAWVRASRSVPSGSFRASSAPKSQLPVTFCAAEGRMYLVPFMLSPSGLNTRSSLVSSPRITFAASITASIMGL